MNHLVICFCTWVSDSELHGCSLHTHICVEGASIETTVFLHDICQMQTNVQAVGAVDSAPVAVVLAHQAPLHLLAHPDNDPAKAVQHPLQNDLVDGTIVLVVALDGQVVALLCYQLCVCHGRFWRRGLCAVDLF